MNEGIENLKEKRCTGRIFFYNARNGINNEKSYEHAQARDGMICPSGGRQVSIRRTELETKHGRSSSDDTAYTCYRTLRQLASK